MSAQRSFAADLKALLKRRPFRQLMATRIASQTADGVFQAALASLILFSPEKAASPNEAASILAVTVLPFTLVGPIAGIALDLWPRRRSLVITNALRAAVVLGIVGILAADGAYPLLLVSVLFAMTLNRFFVTGLGACLPRVVPPQEIVMANGVTPTTGTIAFMSGGALVIGLRPLLVSQVGIDADTVVLAMLLAAATGYALSAWAAARIAPHQLGPDLAEVAAWQDQRTAGRRSLLRAIVHTALQDVVLAVRHVRERRAAFHALAMIYAQRVSFVTGTIAAIMVCRNTLADSSDLETGMANLTVVAAATGIGFGLAAVITPAVVQRWGTGGWIYRSLLIGFAAQLAWVSTANLLLLIGISLVLGLMSQSAKICVDAIVQLSVDDEYRGRTFALYDMVVNSAVVTAAGLVIVAVPLDGYSRATTVLLAVLYLLAGLIYGRAMRRNPPPKPEDTPAHYPVPDEPAS